MRITDVVVSGDGKSVRLGTDRGLLTVFGISENILRCVYTKGAAVSDVSPVGIGRGEGILLRSAQEEDAVVVETGRIRLCVDRGSGRFTWYEKETGKLLLREGDKELTQVPLMEWSTGGEEPVYRRVHTVDGDRSVVENLRPIEVGTAYRAKLHFAWQADEKIHGLGQGEEGIFDYRGKTQYLYQHNMRIPMPWLLSSRGYAILADCGSLMTYNDDERGAYLFLETVEQLDYYFVCGKNADELIRGYRQLTGKASLLPKWAYGYVQSKERYETQEELVEIAREYRRRGVGLDCVVQDWKTWVGDHWGEKLGIDRERFPDLKKMRDELHALNVHSMVSVWPNMNYNTVDNAQMMEAGYLLNDLSTYDAFNPDARRLYWDQAYEGLYHDGFDSWWCDSTEPFPGPDWGGETLREPWERFELVGNEHKKYLGAKRANLFAKAHAQGIFENQRGADPLHRVLNLTRSAYAGSQKYGVVPWSGDTAATWETLRVQITEGLNMAASGMPWWTLDIGAFFVVKENWPARGCGCSDDPTPKWFWHGDFEQGLNDPGYKELYVRWLQMGVFLPMFRSHGTDVPREIWRFGDAGDVFYDAIAKSVALRYRLMPYIYSLCGAVVCDDDTMMRPLFFDFPEDERAASEHQSFMFGRSLLICPVTEPAYYLPGGAAVEAGRENRNVPDMEAYLREGRERKVYLPAGCSWYDFCTGERFEGGREVSAPAGMDRIPVFVRAGSIIPMEKKLTYAAETSEDPLEIHVYPGVDADFLYYEDSGDGYEYEDGFYSRVAMHWDEAEQALEIGGEKLRFPGGIAGRVCELICGEKRRTFVYSGDGMKIRL